MMIRAADLLAEAGGSRAWPAPPPCDPTGPRWPERIREEATDDWDDTVAVERFEGKGGRLVRGWGRLDGPRRVVVGDRIIEASRAVVLGIGARAWIPPVAGLADTPYWTNREAIETEEVPASLAVLGGGAIGVELAQVFRRFGVRGDRARGRAPPGRAGGARGGRAAGRGVRATRGSPSAPG